MIATTKLYRIGVTSSCPVHQITVGGFCFPRRTERVTGHGSETRRDEVKGSIVELSDENIERIKEGASKRVVRATKNNKRAQVYHVEGKYFRPRPEDQSVSKFLYIEPLSSSPFEDSEPATLAEQPAPSKRQSLGGQKRGTIKR